jgi:cytochrome P450
MFSLKLGSGTAIVLTDRRIIKELLDKKSSSSSARPVSEVAQGIITGNDSMLVMDNTPTWRAMRKLVHQEFTESRCDKEHIKVQDAEASQLLHDICISPKDFMSHSSRFSNSVIMSLC